MRKHKIEEERKGAGWYSRRISRILVRRPLPWCFVPSTYLGVVVAVVVVVVVVGAPTLISCPPNLLDIVPIFLSAAEYLCALPSPLCRISPSPHPLSRPPPFLLSYPYGAHRIGRATGEVCTWPFDTLVRFLPRKCCPKHRPRAHSRPKQYRFTLSRVPT